MHHHDISYPRDATDRCDVSHEIEAEICVERGVDRIRGANLQKRIAIGGCLHDRLGGDSAGSARSVLDYELLAQPVRQPLSHQACRDVSGPASRKADDNADRPRRVGLCACNARDGRQRGSAGGQLQKISAGKFHVGPPSHHSITSSAVASSFSGTVRPRLVAVFRLMANSNLTGASTGRSAGLAPFRMRSTYEAVRRKMSDISGPYDIRPPSATNDRYA